MLLATEHLRALEQLGDDEGTGYVAESGDSQSAIRVLELEGLAAPRGGQSYGLTYVGQEALGYLRRMREANALPATAALARGWRFLASEVLAAIAAAAQVGGRIGPEAVELLEQRGLAEVSRTVDGGASAAHLSVAALAWLELARRARPRIEITHELADTLLHLPIDTYFTEHTAPRSPAHLAQLEAMELLAWTAPDGAFGMLTPLGRLIAQAVRKAGHPASDAVLDDAILPLLTRVARGDAALPDTAMAELQIMGYLDADRALTIAGQTAARAHGLLDRWNTQPPRFVPIPTFALSSPEVEILAALRRLGQAASREDLRTALVERLEQRLQDFVGEYGRTPSDSVDTLTRKRQAQRLQHEVGAHERAFDDPSRLERQLVDLTAWGLVTADEHVSAATGEAPRYRLSQWGGRVLDEQGDQPREITADAVKAVTALVTDLGRFQAPATTWVERAHTERLLGSAGVTDAGRLYAQLAVTGPRLPFLARDEADALHHVPTQDEASTASTTPAPDLDDAGETRDHHWPIERLEAYGLVARLVDGQLVRSARGDLLARAVSGTSQLAYPVTPTLIALLTALKQRGETLYTVEERPRAVAQHWDEVVRVAGITPQDLPEALQLARLGGYLGDAGLTEAGKNLIAVFGAAEPRKG